MKIFVTLKPNAKQVSVKQLDATHFAVSVKAPPIAGKANAAMLALLAKQLRVPKTNLQLVRGAKARQKVVELKD